MTRIGLSRFTYANTAATIALLVAIGTGAAFAASISGSSLTNRSVSHRKIKLNTLTGSEIREASLATVPNAAKLGGTLAAAYAPATKLRTFNVRLAFGQSQTLFTAGTLTFTATCGAQNSTSPYQNNIGKDWVALFVSTSADGAGFVDGAGVARDLDIATVQDARDVATIDVATAGTTFQGQMNSNGYGMQAIDHNGVAVMFPDGLAGAITRFGSDCTLSGMAIVT